MQLSEGVLGVGNGDGKPQPGEMIVIAARDGNAVRPVKYYLRSLSRYFEESLRPVGSL